MLKFVAPVEYSSRWFQIGHLLLSYLLMKTFRRCYLDRSKAIDRSAGTRQVDVLMTSWTKEEPIEGFGRLVVGLFRIGGCFRLRFVVFVDRFRF